MFFKSTKFQRNFNTFGVADLISKHNLPILGPSVTIFDFQFLNPLVGSTQTKKWLFQKLLNTTILGLIRERERKIILAQETQWVQELC